MTTDDRDDIESNSPASFKVGEVDRLSGFFTPVWESKRRLRAESPIPPASAAAAPSSAGTESEPAAESEAPARQPSQPPPPPRRAAPTATFVAATPPRASRPPIKGRPSAAPAAGRAPDDAAAKGGSPPVKGGAPRPEKRAAAGLTSPAKGAADTTSEPAPTPRARPEEQRARAAAAEAAALGTAAEPAQDSMTPSVTVRPVIPMPQNPGRTTPRARPSSVPPAAEQQPARRSHPGAPNVDDVSEPVPPREPELRTAPPTSAPPARASWPAADQRAVRAAGAAAVLHDKLRGKAVDSVETFGRHRETESEREALQRAAGRAAATPPDPYPLHLLRTLRRTLHLSVPLPESVRAMIDKYRY